MHALHHNGHANITTALLSECISCQRKEHYDCSHEVASAACRHGFPHLSQPHNGLASRVPRTDKLFGTL
jgi:hypothetical protein